jgi:predicted RNase H-like HicB family nuclease
MNENPEIEFSREEDGRWIAEAVDLPGVMAYGVTKDEAQAKVEELARQVLQEQKPET